MLGKGWEWRITHEDYMFRTKIVPFQQTDEKFTIAYPSVLDEGFEWEAKIFKIGELIPAELERRFLTLQPQAVINLMRALIHEFGNPDKPAVQAELDATKFHLKDMRRLVFSGK